MNKKIYAFFLLLSSSIAFSQTPEDALRLSWYHISGTARNQALGGAIVSLGGDAMANHVNPAGLAFYKTSDFLITPGFKFGKEKSDFRGTDNSGESQTNGLIGATGFIFGGFGQKAKNSFAITVSKIADFNQKTYYAGSNDYSSFAEPLADEFASSNLTIDQALNSPNISVPTKMSIYTYVVDTLTVNGNQQVIARSENPSVRDQKNTSESSGGITEIAFGFGTEINKKLLAGFSLGVDIINYDRKSYFYESDATGNTDNDFSYLSYSENFSQDGYGFNLKGGLIYRPREYIRLGLAVHTPTWMPLTENLNSGFAADIENHFGAGNGYDSVASSVFTGGTEIQSKYVLNTPTKIMISGSYVFREEARIERQKGFLTADIEYLNYKWLKYTAYDENISDDYYTENNIAIDETFKGTFNFRLGGELKFKTLMARAGFAYYGNPYEDSELKGQKMFLSGGFGYRNKGMFVDISYVQRLNKDVNFPYRVSYPRANTYAILKDNGGNILLTLGFKI